MIEEDNFYIQNIGPFEIYGCNHLVKRFVATGGYYERDNGEIIGPVIYQKINRFDEKGNFLPREYWYKDQMDSFYWWIKGNKKIKIEVH